MLRAFGHIATICALVGLVGCGSDPESKPAEPKPANKSAAAPVAEQNPAGMKAAPSPTEPGTEPTGLVPAVEAIAEEACKCKSKDCANAVQDKVMEIMKDAKKPTKEEAVAMGAAMQKAQKCIAEAQAK